MASKSTILVKTFKEPMIFLGTVILCLFLLAAVAAPWIAPFDQFATEPAARLRGTLSASFAGNR